MTVIQLDCGHWYDHHVPAWAASRPDTVSIGIKPPKNCPKCSADTEAPDA